MRKIPEWCHRRDGRGYVSDPTRLTAAGKPTQLPMPTRADYERWRADYLAHAERPRKAPARCTVDQLIDAYLPHAHVYYRKRDRPTSHLGKVKMAARAAREVWGGDRSASDVRASDLESVLHRLATDGYVMKTCNDIATTICAIWEWGVRQDAVDPVALARLRSAQRLKRGRSPARVAPRVGVAPADAIAAVVAQAKAPVADMIRLQELGGMRPAEICALRPADLQREGVVWVYTVHPDYDKTAHRRDERGHASRRVYFGPQAQAILAPLLEPTYIGDTRTAQVYVAHGPETPLFRLANGKPISVHVYRNRIKRACAAAGVAVWKPNQLRHSRATEIRRIYGLDAARAFLGHENADVTEVYADRDAQLAARVAAETG